MVTLHTVFHILIISAIVLLKTFKAVIFNLFAPVAHFRIILKFAGHLDQSAGFCP